MEIELGGGGAPSYHPNVDILHGDEGYQVDVRSGLPFGDGEVTLIRSGDFFEHLSFLDGLALLRECRRVLAPEGMLDWLIPDVGQALAYHNAGPSTGWCWDLEMVLYGSRENEWQTHKAWYTPELMAYVLDKEGWRSEFLHTNHGWPEQPKFQFRAWPE